MFKHKVFNHADYSLQPGAEFEQFVIAQNYIKTFVSQANYFEHNECIEPAVSLQYTHIAVCQCRQ